MSRQLSTTREAVAMRRLRAERAAERGPRPPVWHVYLVERAGRAPTWEGRVQVDGRRLVIARSTAKHGDEEAHQIVARQVRAWLADAGRD